MARTLAAWLGYLEQLHPVGIDMGLERVADVARRMQLLDGPIAPRVVTVAGTNGKGSTLAMMATVATAHGMRVGTYTSPHLVRYNERVTLLGNEASDDLLVAGFEQVEAARCRSPEISLTYFEAGTLCALWCLAQARLDIVFLEVGLGGRLDAVNIIDADVAIVTTIALDHASFLGTDLAQIGREKAGVFRAGRPAVLGSQCLPDSVADTARNLGAPLYELGETFERSLVEGGLWEWQGRSPDGQRLTLDNLPDPGLPLDNAATALQALTLAGCNLSAEATRQALGNVVLSGRMQWIGQWCLDVGHNPHAAAYLAKRLGAQINGRLWCVIGMLDDKDIEGVVAHLIPVVTDWVCVGLSGPRGRSAQSLAAAIERQGGAVQACAATPTLGAAWLKDKLVSEDCVLATGSFFTVGELLATDLPQARCVKSM
ncbi:MAG: bifunctional tetrahydrofolate synthase/dihydrofolate synthase [Pseudomonadota bacterium]|jgi:dihydrofolate synthase/folylpolyglutamate synthase